MTLVAALPVAMLTTPPHVVSAHNRSDCPVPDRSGCAQTPPKPVV